MFQKHDCEIVLVSAERTKICTQRLWNVCFQLFCLSINARQRNEFTKLV